MVDTPRRARAESHNVPAGFASPPTRSDPDYALAAWGLLDQVVDLGGWAPDAPTDDWAAIADAARVAMTLERRRGEGPIGI